MGGGVPKLGALVSIPFLKLLQSDFTSYVWEDRPYMILGSC